MKRVTKILVLLSLFFAALLFSQQEVVAVVNGRNITMDEWNREANIQKLLFDIQNSNEVFYQILTTSQEGVILLERYKLKVLDTLIRKIAFVQFAENLKVAPTDVTVKNDVENEIKKMLTDLKMTEAQLNDYLVKLGMGQLEDYRQRLYMQRRYSLALANVYMYYLDQEAKIQYEKNKENYNVPTQYDLIVFKTKDKTSADNIRQELIRNTPVDEIAKKYNINNYINGFVNQNDTSKVPQSLWVLITNVSKGTILPVQNIAGEFYIIRVRDVKLGGARTFEEVKEEIKKELLNAKQDEVREKVSKDFEEFYKKSKIEIRYKSQIIKQ
ncbi:MAG: peptidyl-prolyl cis-trans isomerase [Fervidobacterium sp.]